MSKFTHLHLHTEHSVLDGINRVDSLPEYVRDTLGQSACAITDHGTVSGTYSFYKSCRAAGIKPILGMEAYYAVGDRTVKGKNEHGKNYYHMVLLSTNNQGLHNLYKLSSEAFDTGMYYKPRIDDALLADHSEGILATSACLGSRSSQLIMNGQVKEAEMLLDHHAAMFPDKFFIELQLHEDDNQQLVNKTLMEIASKRNWPLLLTNDCHYTHEDDKQLHEETLCMQTGSVMSAPPYNHESSDNDFQGKPRFSFGDIDVHVAHHDWLWERAQRQGIPYEAISNTMAVQNLVDDESYFIDRRNRYPHYPNLPEDLPPWIALENLAKEGLHKRLDGQVPEIYKQRLESELKVIKKMGFYDYLLIVKSIQDGARDIDVLIGPGRGSVAGSLVAWALRITEIDPIKYGLVFERWLNPGRAARPLLLSQDMIKKIKESPNGSHTDCVSCDLGIHGRHDTVRSVRPDCAINSSVQELPNAKEGKERNRIELTPNLLQCFNNGLGV